MKVLESNKELVEIGGDLIFVDWIRIKWVLYDMVLFSRVYFSLGSVGWLEFKLKILVVLDKGC